MEAIQELSERKTKILHAIIKNYLETGRACGIQNDFQVYGFEFKFGNNPE